MRQCLGFVEVETGRVSHGQEISWTAYGRTTTTISVPTSENVGLHQKRPFWLGKPWENDDQLANLCKFRGTLFSDKPLWLCTCAVMSHFEALCTAKAGGLTCPLWTKCFSWARLFQQSLHPAFWWWLWVGLTKSKMGTYSKPVEQSLTSFYHL